LQFGYNHSLPSRLLLGIEGDISCLNYLDDGIVASRSTPFNSVTEKLDFVSTIRGRVGYTALRNLREGKLKLRKADPRRSVPASLRRVWRGSCEPRQSVPLHRLTPQSLRPVVQDLSQALQSRSATNPQGPRNTRCDKSSSALTEPQQEQVLLEGNHRSATTTDAP
jgi:hypothetical protein